MAGVTKLKVLLMASYLHGMLQKCCYWYFFNNMAEIRLLVRMDEESHNFVPLIIIITTIFFSLALQPQWA
jgi:hypothetical protein